MLPKILKTNFLYRAALNIKKKFDQQKNLKLERLNSTKRIEFYKSFLKQNDLVFDVGANIGNRVEAFRELGCNVVAVEPQTSCALILKNKFGQSIKIEEVGLGKQEGQMEMFIADETTISTFSKEFIEKMQSGKFKRNNWNNRIEVPITTLDNLIKKYGTPKFCKIDVEGFEPEVLAGLNSSIPIVSFEYNVPELNLNVENCVEKLNKLSARYRYNYSIGESMQLRLQNWMSYDEFTLFIKSPEFLNSDFGDIYASLLQNESNN